MAVKLSGGASSGKFRLNQNSEINVTPFVDVMLVLLIIFMVAIPTATVSIRLDLPPAQPPDGPVKEPLLINIQPGGAVFIGDRPSGLSSLTGDLAKAITERSPGVEPTRERVYIRADRKVRYREFMAVMNLLQEAGYFQVALINEELD